MNYNDGNVHLDFYNKSADKKEIARQFAEGDPLLYETILELWEKGIKTLACCKGHTLKDGSQTNPYLSIIIDEKSEQIVRNICNFIHYYNRDGFDLRFSNNLFCNGVYDLYISVSDNISWSEILRFIKYCMVNKIEFQGPKSDMLTYIKCLMEVGNQNNICFHHCIFDDRMVVYFSKKNMLPPDVEDELVLDEEMLNFIKKHNKIPNTVMSCDEQSIKKLAEIFSPGISEKEETQNYRK